MTNKIVYLKDYKKRIAAKQELLDLKNRIDKELLEEKKYLAEAKKKECEDIEYLAWLSQGLYCAIAGQLPFYEIEILVDVARSERRFR